MISWGEYLGRIWCCIALPFLLAIWWMISSLEQGAVSQRCRPASGDLGSSKNLDFQAPWHHFQFVRLFG
jgi:hypothetical protein